MALSSVVLFGLWSVAGGGTYAALTGSTGNAANTFSAGTVTLTDNDSNAAMFSIANARPGVPESGCIKVSYGGSLNASVRMYGAVSGALAPHVKLTVVRGTDATPAFDNCAAFTPDATNYTGQGAGVLYTGTLAGYPVDHAGGVVDPISTWTPGTSASYRFTVEILDTNSAQGQNATATFTWEARS